jgi:hypothetical protein
MIQRRKDERFPPQSCAALIISRKSLWQHFQRDVTPKFGVAARYTVAAGVVTCPDEQRRIRRWSQFNPPPRR